MSSDNEREETEAAVVTDTVENLSNGSFRGDGDGSGRGKLGPMKPSPPAKFNCLSGMFIQTATEWLSKEKNDFF